MVEMTYSEYLARVSGGLASLGEAAWLRPALAVIARRGTDVSTQELARAYAQQEALEPHVLRNLKRDIAPPLSTFDASEPGTQAIERAILWACLCPGNPAAAMQCAAQDAAVDCKDEAAEALRFWAGVLSLAFVKSRAEDCLQGAMVYLPEESALAKMALEACSLCARQPETVRARFAQRYGGVDASLRRLMAESVTEILLGGTGTTLAAAFAGICTGKQQDSPAEEALLLARAGAACLRTVQQRGERVPLRLTDVPEVAALEKATPESGISVSYMGPPVLRPGLARQCILSIANRGTTALEGPVTWTVEGCVQAMTAAHARVRPGETARIPFTVWMPENVETVTECNRMTVRFAGLETAFGIAGAQGYWVAMQPQNGAPLLWDPFFSDGNELNLDELVGWRGACSILAQRTIVVRQAARVQVRVTHTVAFSMEWDGCPLMEGAATDGWMRAQTPLMDLELTPGRHSLVLRLERTAPRGCVGVEFWQNGQLLSMEGTNPFKENL